MPNKTHGHTTGKRGSTVRSLTYNSWRSMKERCYMKSNTSYKKYGAKGIVVCDRWLDFGNFLEDMGERPEGCVLARNNDSGNYEPGNVSWKTLEQNSSEKKSAVGSRCGNSRFKEEDIARIRRLYVEGKGARELGRTYNVSHSTILAIVKYKTWTHV